MRTHLKSLFAVVVGFGGMFLLSGCDTHVAAPTSFGSYNAKDGTFQCECPDGWEIDGGGKKTQWAVFSSGGAEIRVNTNVSGSLMGDIAKARNNGLGITEPDENMTPVAQVHDAEQEVFGEDYTDFEEQPATTVKTGFGDTRVSEFTASGSLGGKIHGYRATALSRDFRVRVVCTCPESNWAELQPAFDRVIESLGRGKVER